MNAGDQIDGGAGTDTLKVFGTYNAAQMPVSIKNVEVLDIATLADAALDLSSLTKAATGIGNVVVGNAAAVSGKQITTGDGQSISLSTGAANLKTAGAVTWAASTKDTTVNLTLNGYQGADTNANAQNLTVTAAQATTMNLAATGAASKVSTFTLGAKTNKLVVTGDQKLTVTTDVVSSGGATVLKTIDASANTGGVSMTLAAATNAAFAFTGGSGNDTIVFADDGLAALTSGSQLDGGDGSADKIGINDTVITTKEYSALNAAKNFEVLGLNGAVTVDASQLTGLKTFSLDANAAQVIANAATGTVVNVAVAHAANITLGGAVGVNDVTVNVGSATSTGLTVGGALKIGQTNVALTSNGNGTGTNTITTLTNADNSVYTITGSNDLTISAVSATAIGSKYDASGLSGKLNITGNTTAFSAGSSLGDIIIGGSGADTIKASVNSSTLTGNAGNDTFDVSAAVAAATANYAVTSITDFTVGDKIKFGATAGAFTKAAVDLSSAATLADALNLLVAGSNTDVKWGVYGGNTYLVDDVNALASIQANDTVVKIVGEVSLAASTFDAGTNTLTFA